MFGMARLSGNASQAAKYAGCAATFGVAYFLSENPLLFF
jgi:hypothetical protein